MTWDGLESYCIKKRVIALVVVGNPRVAQVVVALDK